VLNIWRRQGRLVGEQGLGKVSESFPVPIKPTARPIGGVLRRLADKRVIRWASMLYVLKITSSDVDSVLMML